MALQFVASTFWSWNFWEGPTQQVVGAVLVLALGAGIQRFSMLKEKIVGVAKSHKLWSSALFAYQILGVLLSGFAMGATEISLWIRLVAWLDICVYAMIQVLDLVFHVQSTTTDLIARNIEITEHLLKKGQTEQATFTPPLLRMPEQIVSPRRTAMIFMLQMIPVIAACFIAFLR